MRLALRLSRRLGADMRIFIVLALAIGIGGCASVPNPISTTNIYQAKNVYSATVKLAGDYRDYCWKRPYAVLLRDAVAGPACKNRRAVVRALVKADDVAFTALTDAETFVRDYPTLDATQVVGAAIRAVGDFQALIPSALK